VGWAGKKGKYRLIGFENRPGETRDDGGFYFRAVKPGRSIYQTTTVPNDRGGGGGAIFVQGASLWSK